MVDLANTDSNMPAAYAAAVTPSDTVDLTNETRALYVGGAGDLSVETIAGNTITLAGAVAGSVIPIRVKRVNSTNTTATNIVAFW